jgi:short-subunit dehydrogenase
MIVIGHKDKYAVVTGASSGIGYELARLVAADDKNLVITARNKEALEQLKSELESKQGISARVLVKDLSFPGAPLEIYSELEKDGIDVDVLVNNAGFGLYGEFSGTELEKELALIQVNIASATCLTKLFLKNMLANKSGKILNVASSLGFIPVPLFSVYAASKAYLLNFSEALACELEGSGVSVTCLCPPPTKTAFWADMAHSKSAKMKMLSAEYVAKAGYRALKKGKLIVAPGWLVKSMLLLTRIAPRKAIPRMMKSSV